MALTSDTMIDGDTRLGDLLPVELFAIYDKDSYKNKEIKKYERTEKEQIEFLTDMIEIYEVMGDIKQAKVEKQKLKDLKNKVNKNIDKIK